MSILKLQRTPVHDSLPAGVGNQPGQADGYRPDPPGRASAADTAASREPQQHNGVAADPAAVAPPGCTCGGRSICLHCFFAEAGSLEQTMMAAALDATERALANEVAS